ncbi:MAG: hypothetical protein ACQEP1_01365 [Nanobdellota archaeon]
MNDIPRRTTLKEIIEGKAPESQNLEIWLGKEDLRLESFHKGHSLSHGMRPYWEAKTKYGSKVRFLNGVKGYDFETLYRKTISAIKKGEPVILQGSYDGETFKADRLKVNGTQTKNFDYTNLERDLERKCYEDPKNAADSSLDLPESSREHIIEYVTAGLELDPSRVGKTDRNYFTEAPSGQNYLLNGKFSDSLEAIGRNAEKFLEEYRTDCINNLGRIIETYEKAQGKSN